MKIKVAVFEDNHGLRKNLELLIDNSEGMLCTGAFANADKLETNLALAEPDVVLMDINMPGMSGIEAVWRIKEKFPSIRILMQTVFDDNDKIFAAICAGADGYLLKKTPAKKMIEAIRETFAGNTIMNPSVASKVLTMFRQQADNSTKEFFNLSAREKEVLALLVKGKQYKNIAAECFISIDTVGTHVRHIYEKLHVHSKSEAVAKAIQQKLI